MPSLIGVLGGQAEIDLPLRARLCITQSTAGEGEGKSPLPLW